MRAFILGNMILGGLMLACSAYEPPRAVRIPPRPTAPVTSRAVVTVADDASEATDVSKMDTATATSEGSFNPAAVVSLPDNSSGESETGAADSYPKSFATSALDLNTAEQMRDVCRVVSGFNRPLDPTLCQVAQGYADLLARTHQEGHYADGTPWARAARAGFKGSLLFNERPGAWYFDGGKWKRVIEHDGGEVLAFHAQSIGDAFDGWMKSTGHRAALMEPSFDVCGFGHNGTTYVGLFGNSTSQASAAATPGYVNQPSRTAALPPYVIPGLDVPNRARAVQSCSGPGCGNVGRFRIFGRR